MGKGRMFRAVLRAAVFGVAAGAVLAVFKRKQMSDEYEKPCYQPPLSVLSDHPMIGAPWPTPQTEPEYPELAKKMSAGEITTPNYH